MHILQLSRATIKRPEAKKTIESDTKKIDFVSRASKTFVKQTFQTIAKILTILSKNMLPNLGKCLGQN